MAYAARQGVPPRAAPLRPLRDFVFDHTPFLQKVVGDASPGEIVEQLAEIDEAEHRRRCAWKPA